MEKRSKEYYNEKANSEGQKGDNMKKTDVDFETELTQEQMEDSMLAADPLGIHNAQMAAKFMFAMEHYHKRMKFHMMVQPLYFLAGFLLAYALI